MDGFNPAFASATLAACETNAAEIALALSRAFGTEVTVSIGELVDASAPAPEEWNGSGLMIPLRIAAEGAESVVAILPAASGLLPDWVAEPDESGANRLGMLAQELAMLLFPPEINAEARPAAWTPNLSAAFEQTSAANSGRRLSLQLQLASGASAGVLEIVWPVVVGGTLNTAAPNSAGAAAATGDPAAMGTPKSTAPAASPSRPATQSGHPPAEPAAPAEPLTLESLPSFSRNLLRIKMPVMVTLASKKQSVAKIIELLPGSIIQFSKSCEEMLEMEVSGQPIALGECVKVGDKFGLRLTSIQLPGERFATVGQALGPR